MDNRTNLLRALNDVMSEIAVSDSNYYWSLCALRDAICTDTDRYLAVSVDDPTRVAYSRDGVARDDHDRRIKISLMRYVRRYMSGYVTEVPDHILSEFCQSIMSRVAGAIDIAEQHIKIVEGQEIVIAYEREFAWRSCMTGSDACYVEIYAKNPDKVKLLLFDNGTYRARCLVWHDDCGHVLLDRIYPNDSPAIASIEQWAMSRGWIVRKHHQLPSGDSVQFSDGEIHKVTLRSDTGIWPYMDSFHWAIGDPYEATCYTARDGILSPHVLSSCEGDFGSYYCRCTECDTILSLLDDEGIRVGDDDTMYCRDCVERNHTYCPNDGEWYPDSEVVYPEDTVDPYHCHDDNIHYCAGCGDAYLHLDGEYCDGCRASIAAEDAEETANEDGWL